MYFWCECVHLPLISPSSRITYRSLNLGVILYQCEELYPEADTRLPPTDTIHDQNLERACTLVPTLAVWKYNNGNIYIARAAWSNVTSVPSSPGSACTLIYDMHVLMFVHVLDTSDGSAHMMHSGYRTPRVYNGVTMHNAWFDIGRVQTVWINNVTIFVTHALPPWWSDIISTPGSQRTYGTCAHVTETCVMSITRVWPSDWVYYLHVPGQSDFNFQDLSTFGEQSRCVLTDGLECTLHQHYLVTSWTAQWRQLVRVVTILPPIHVLVADHWMNVLIVTYAYIKMHVDSLITTYTNALSFIDIIDAC
jgi:hypothetical protein